MHDDEAKCAPAYSGFRNSGIKISQLSET